MFTEFFMVSGVLFWVYVVFFALLVAGWLGKENEAGALIVAFLAFVGLWLFSDVGRHVNLYWIAIIGPAYALIGIAWSLHRWRRFVVDRRESARKEFMRAPRDDDFPTWLSKQHHEYRRPTAEQHRERITAWIALWPWSMLWRVVQWPWRAIVWFYDRISSTFERMSKRLWREA